MPLISHRGAAALAPANTIKSVKIGDRFNPAYIEVDVNYTSDDVLVMYHGSVARFLQGKKTKETFDQLQNKHPDLIKFKDFLDYTPHAPYLFDIKVADTAAIESIIELIKKSKVMGCGFTSPHETALQTLQKNFPDALILQSQPYHHGPMAALELARKNNFGGVMLNKWWLNPFVYNLCRMHRKKIGIYTIDSSMAMWLSQRLFPGAYITTNRPDMYRRIFP